MKKSHALLVCALLMLINISLMNLTALAQTCVGGGALTITAAPTSANFANKDTSVNAVENSLIFGSSLNFEDMRNTSAGFTITVTSTTFENINDINDTFTLTNLKMTSDDNDTIGLVDCDPATGITLDQLTFSAFADSNSDGISDAKGLITGDVRARIGKYSVEPELEINIPGGTPVGNFRTTVTFSIQ